MNKLTSSLICLLFSCTICLSAQAVDLIDVYRASLDEDQQLKAAEAKYKADLEAVPQSRALLLPDISLNANTETIDREFKGGISERFNNNSYSARLTQPIFRADRWFQLKSSQAGSEQAQAILEQARQDLIIRVAQAYFNILRAQDNLSSAIAQETALKRQLEQSQESFDVGLIAITDVHESQAAYDLARVTRIGQEEERDNSFAALEALTGQTYTQITPLDKTVPIQNPTPSSLDDWIEQALATSWPLQAARHRVEAARQEINRQKSGHLPTLDAVASFTHSEAGGTSFLGSESDTEQYGLELSIPLFLGGGTSSRIRQAHHLHDQSRALYQQQYRDIKQSTRTQHRTVTSDVLRVGARKLALRSSQSALEATEGGYEVGTRNIVDVLQARNTLFESQRDYSNAIYDYIINSLELKRTAGLLDEEDLIELNKWLTH
jgi:outer membrane protein